MTRHALAWVITVAVILGLLLVTVAVAQYVSSEKAQGWVPEVITIKAQTPDRARVCVEPPAGGLVNCRTIAELRTWVRERPK